MSVAKCYSAQLSGLTADIVSVEVDISNGLNSLCIVGLGDRAVEEAKDRISAAIKNSGFVSPKQKNQKVVISLAPADLKKEGTAFDLPMAISYLAAAGDIDIDPERTLFFGELALEGNVRRISGLLPILCQAPAAGFTRAYVPAGNIAEASAAPGMVVYGVSRLSDLASALRGEAIMEPAVRRSASWHIASNGRAAPDMMHVRGNESAKRGLEIAAAGAHNVIMHGPPGTGKTLLAKSFPSILPPLSPEEAIEVTGIYSAAKALSGGLITEPPFRAPHHTASYPSVVGGGPVPRPGEITLAHRGVLFLDEFPEFDQEVLEALREPLEERSITISRARGSVTFPAQCILIAAMNPCPCGRPASKGCRCSTVELKAYRRRLSGPIMDRLDIMLNVDKVDYGKLSSAEADAVSSSVMRRRVAAARAIQADRFRLYGSAKRYNSELSAEDIDRIVPLEPAARSWLSETARDIGLSGRAFHRIIKVARTIADLAGKDRVGVAHVGEAIQYRQKVWEL